MGLQFMTGRKGEGKWINQSDALMQSIHLIMNFEMMGSLSFYTKKWVGVFVIVPDQMHWKLPSISSSASSLIRQGLY